MIKRDRFCPHRANILVGKAENKSQQVNICKITTNVDKCFAAPKSWDWEYLEEVWNYFTRVRRGRAFCARKFKQRAEAWERTIHRKSGCKAFWAEGIACAVALRQGITWSASGTEKERRLWPEEQRGEPLGRDEAGEVSKDGSHVTLGESLDSIPSTILSLVLFSSCCNFNHYLAPRTCQLSCDFAGIPTSMCSTD